MPVAIEVPGLDAFAAEIPDGRVVLLEGDLSPAKGHLARRIARTAAEAKRPVTLLTTRGEACDGVQVREAEEWPSDGHPTDQDLVVDSFSLLALGHAPGQVADRLRAIRRSCQKGARIAVLVLDDGLLDPASRAACHHFADGVIQFHVRDDSDGPVTFLRIPKWMDRAGADKNLFYGFDGRQMLIDTRRRVT
jgi:KaiC/GvpD/RAD55 family RecA-like ATPase